MVRIDKIEMQGFKSFAKKTLMTFPSNFSTICGPNGSGKCIEGGSRIVLANGSIKTIKEIVESNIEKSKKIEKMEDGSCSYDNPEGIEVLSLNLSTLKMEKKKVSAFIKRKSPPFLLKIKTRTGKDIIATHYHPLFIIKGGSIRSAKAEELEKGIKIALPRDLPAASNKNSLDIKAIIKSFEKEDLIYIPYSKPLSNFINNALKEFEGVKKLSEISGADYNSIRGVRDKQSMNVADFCKVFKCNGFKTEDISWIEEIKSKTTGKMIIPKEIDRNLARFLGYIISEGRNTDSHQVWFVNNDKNILSDFSSVSKSCFGTVANEFNYKANATDSIIFSQSLCKFIERMFGIGIGEKSAMKKVPEQLFSADKNIASEFLSALFEGDAHIHIDSKKKSSAYIEYATASKRLAEDVSILLLRFGVVSIIKEKLKYATNTENKIKRKYYSVYIYGLTNLKKIADALNFVGEKKATLEKMKKIDCKSNPNIDLIPNINTEIRKLAKLAKINVKKLKKVCPKLDAYCYNQCEISREGLTEVMKLIEAKGKLGKEAKNIIENMKKLASSDIFWDEIVNINKIEPEEWVYDLSIEENHNFIANGFVVHNSNAADAVCFVLGRSSAKGLRADKMLEVIFNGGKGKQPAEFAKVAIFFDNSDKRFPLEESQIAVSRKINRKGVSIYKLNGRTVTREKILEVLHSANIQPDGHNIILQGNVTEIIEMSPLERREIIDEISGIAEFDDKRTKAQRELLTVENRLKESSIVLTERAAQISKLEQESKAAEEYQKLSKELDIFRASVAHKKLSEAESAMNLLDGKIKEKEAASAELDKEFQGEEDGLSKKEKELGELEKKLFNRSKDISIIKEVEKLRSEILLKKNKIESNKIEIERINNIIEKLNMLQQRSMEQSASRPVQEILRLNRTGVYGTIASLSRVSGEYQTAIEVAAGAHMQDIVVADSTIAVECIKFLKQNKIGRATFLPLDKIRQRYGELPKESGNAVATGVIDLAINLVDFDSKYLNAFSFIFGDTIIVDRIDTAKKLGSGKRYVTLDGDIIEKSGAMIGGFYHKERKSLFEANEIKKYQTQKEQLEDGAAKIDEELVGLEKQLRSLQTEEEKGSTELTDTEKQREQISKDMGSIREKRKAVYEKRLIIQSDVNRLKIQKARLEAELDNLKLEFNNYKKENIMKEKIEILEAKLRETFIAIQKLGPINMKAVEEFAQQSAVYNELKERVEKLSAERDKILYIMIEIESKRKETFSKTLSAVSEQFKTVFHDLTGGEADLHLEEDSLESGLVIEASPAGKKLLNIDGMSGGEKTLVALAFLFAVQRFRPAPFYILDEVDAALDKPNSRKIVDLVKKYAEGAQFIMISHNDLTIQQADCVYGVSMENGESKLVGIRMPG